MAERAIVRTRPEATAFLPYLALVFGILGLGFSAIFVRWAGAPGAVSGFYRLSIAAAVMALPASNQARRQSPLSRRHVWFAVLAGVFFAADITSWNTAVLISNAANATLLANTSPLWVGIGALLLFKERLRPLFWAGLLLAIFGAIVILGRDFLTHPTLGLGDLLGLLAGFFYGGFFLATQKARDRLSSSYPGGSPLWAAQWRCWFSASCCGSL
jgi:drug/metabolite transporter (DMT)-like permease